MRRDKFRGTLRAKLGELRLELRQELSGLFEKDLLLLRGQRALAACSLKKLSGLLARNHGEAFPRTAPTVQQHLLSHDLVFAAGNHVATAEHQYSGAGVHGGCTNYG